MIVQRMWRALSDLLFEGIVFPLAELPRQKPRPDGWWAEQERLSDEATAEWLHNLDVKTRTEILMKAVDSKQAEEAEAEHRAEQALRNIERDGGVK